MPDQLPLLGPRGGLRPKSPPADVPVGRAQVLVDAKASQLRRVFDYSVPSRLVERLTVGCRVKVPVAGQVLPGIVVGIADPVVPEVERTLRQITSLVSDVPVLQPQILQLCETVATHYAGAVADVVRFAVPPRNAAAERGFGFESTAAGPLNATPEVTRSAWICPPATDWAAEVIAVASPVLASGLGVIVLVPDSKDVDRIIRAVTAVDLTEDLAVLRAEDGVNVRYEQFLKILSGRARLVVGSRSAAFAPVRDLGLCIMWDDGNTSYEEPRAPYPHAREVLAFRSHHEHTSLLLAGRARSCETQRWVQAGWLTEHDARATIRSQKPSVRPVGDPLSPFDSSRRFPDIALRALREGLKTGSVLVLVSSAGHVPVTACTQCRNIAECSDCGGGLGIDVTGEVTCRRCGQAGEFLCPECEGTTLRAVRVGATRTAAEMTKMFPAAEVVVSTAASGYVREVGQQVIVVATAGMEPIASQGFSAAYFPDAQNELWRPQLRARESALARWLNASALVRPGGVVIVNADGDDETVQAFVRWDPIGFAERELVRRSDLDLPPASQLLQLDGPLRLLEVLVSQLDSGTTGESSEQSYVRVLGPRPFDDDEQRARVLLRADQFADLRQYVRSFIEEHPAATSPGWRLQVDPAEVE